MRCGIVGLGTPSVEVDQEIMPTIAHVSTGIVHGAQPSNDGFEKVPHVPTVTLSQWMDCSPFMESEGSGGIREKKRSSGIPGRCGPSARRGGGPSPGRQPFDQLNFDN